MFLFLRTTVTIDEFTPSATIGPVPLTLELAAIGTVSTKVILLVSVLRLLGDVRVSVFTSSIVDLKDPIDTPLESDAEPWIRILALPETVNTGLMEATGLL